MSNIATKKEFGLKGVHLNNQLILLRYFKRFKFIFPFILFLSYFNSFSQTKELDTPELPEWVNSVIYIDYSATGSTNVGTYENPLTNWDSNNSGFSYTGRLVTNAQNTAFLFKKGVLHDVQRVGMNWVDSVYIGAYGQGDKPILQASMRNSGGFIRLNSKYVYLYDLEIRDHPADTTYLSETIRTQGYASNPGLFNRSGATLKIKNVDVTYGYRGISAAFHEKIEIDNTYFGNIWHDAMYMMASDSMFIRDTHIEKYNVEWRQPSGIHAGYHEDYTIGDPPGGDGIQVGDVLYTEIHNTIVDGSRYGGKFNFIHSQSTIEGHPAKINIYNSTFYQHRFKTAFHLGPSVNIYNSKFIGQGGLGRVSGSKFYNSLFIGLQSDFVFTWDATSADGYATENAGGEFYNCVFANYHTVLRGNTQPNVRNSVFYNFNSGATVHSYGQRYVDATGNVYYNPGETIDASGIDNILRSIVVQWSQGPAIMYYNHEAGGFTRHSSTYYRALQASGPDTGAGNRNPSSEPSYWTQVTMQEVMDSLRIMVNVDPMFVNPNIDVVLIDTDNRTYPPPGGTGDYVHHYYIWNDYGDWRLHAESPLINAADPNVYDDEATFISDRNYFNYAGIVRGFTDNHKVTEDIIGTHRPQGDGYDIGAFEYMINPATTSYTIDFIIKNQQNDSINNATINFNGVIYPAGNYSMEKIEEGTYNYSISAPGYENYVFTGLVVESNMEITVVMTELPVYNLNFEIKDSQYNPIENATITFGGPTNPPGTYSFTAISAGSYNYKVSAPGFQTVQTNNFQVTQDTTIEVIMNHNSYDILLNATPALGGYASGPGSYHYGETVTVAAEANENYSFVNWSENGSVVSNNASYTFTVTQSRNLTANFSLEAFSVSYNTDSNGSIVGNTSQFVIYGANGEPVLAVADLGHHFVRWCDQLTDNPRIEIYVTQDHSKIARFAKNVYQLVYSSDSNGYLLGETEQFAEFGENATSVKAVPNNGYKFLDWSDGLENNPRIDLNISNDIQVFARFELMLTFEEPTDQEVLVYPIPTKNVLNVEVLLPDEFDVYILNIQGLLIKNLPRANQGSNSYNVSWLSPGVYFINLVSSSRRITRKFIKKQ